jgi:hypothetical protein
LNLVQGGTGTGATGRDTRHKRDTISEIWEKGGTNKDFLPSCADEADSGAVMTNGEPEKCTVLYILHTYSY